MRGKGGGSGGYTITFKNIVVEDPRPTLQPFKILMEGRYYISFHAVKRLPRHYLNDLKAELSQVGILFGTSFLLVKKLDFEKTETP